MKIKIINVECKMNIVLTYGCSISSPLQGEVGEVLMNCNKATPSPPCQGGDFSYTVLPNKYADISV